MPPCLTQRPDLAGMGPFLSWQLEQGCALGSDKNKGDFSYLFFFVDK